MRLEFVSLPHTHMYTHSAEHGSSQKASVSGNNSPTRVLGSSMLVWGRVDCFVYRTRRNQPASLQADLNCVKGLTHARAKRARARHGQDAFCPDLKMTCFHKAGRVGLTIASSTHDGLLRTVFMLPPMPGLAHRTLHGIV